MTKIKIEDLELALEYIKVNGAGSMSVHVNEDHGSFLGITCFDLLSQPHNIIIKDETLESSPIVTKTEALRRKK